MKRRGLALSIVLSLWLWLIMVPNTANAQGRTWAGTSLARMVDTARWKLGAFRVNASLSLVNAGYDTDVYYGYFSERLPDVTFSASVPIQILLPLGKQAVLELNESPQYLFYLDTERERAWNNTVGGRIHFALERLYIQAGGARADVRQRMSPELDVNIRGKFDTLNGTLLWQAGRTLSLAALYNFAKYNYGNSVFGDLRPAETLNRNEYYFDIQTYIEPSERIRLFIDGQYGLYKFPSTALRERDARSYGVFGGFSFVPRLTEAGPIDPPQGNISLGYKYFNVLEAALKDGSGFVGSMDFSIGLFSKITVRAFLSRDFAFSVYTEGTYYLSTTYGGGIRRQLSRKMTFSYDLILGQSAYPQNAAAEESISRDFRYTSHAFGLNVRLARHLGVTFQAALSRRVLGDIEPARNRNFFGLSLVYGVSSGSISAPTRGLS
jgi:hypothetical protein